MEPTHKPHVSHAIAWSLIALFAGSLAFGIWMYSNQIDTIYAGSVSISVTHEKTAATKPTAATTDTTTTTDATADWKTYTNTTYGFSIKYPKLYTLTDTLPKTIKTNTPKDVLELKKDQIDISFWPKPAGWGYEDYNKEISTEQIKVGGVSATERVLSNGSLAISVLSTNDSNPFFFWAPIGQQSDKTEFDQILSTFTFTK